MRNNKRQLVSFDWAMKRLLRQKANYVVLEGFLSELFREDITILSFEDSESNKSDETDKYNRVDLLVKDSKGHLVLVEVQYDSEMDYFQRMLYGTSKLITDYLSAGEPYDQVKKVISVNLVYFDLGQGKDYIYWGKTDFKGLHFWDDLELSQKQKERFQIQCVSDIYPEYYILKLNSFDDYAKDTLDEWVYTLKNGILPAEYKAKGLKEAEEVLNMINMSESELAEYDRYMENKRLQASVIGSTIKRAEEAEAKAEEAQAKAEEAEAKAEEAEAKAEEAEAKAEEAEAKAEEAKARALHAEDEKKQVLEQALNSLIAAGFDEAEARQQLGL